MLANYNESIYLFEEMEICSVNTVILVIYYCMIPILKKLIFARRELLSCENWTNSLLIGRNVLNFEQFVENTAGEYRTQYYSTIDPIEFNQKIMHKRDLLKQREFFFFYLEWGEIWGQSQITGCLTRCLYGCY